MNSSGSQDQNQKCSLPLHIHTDSRRMVYHSSEAVVPPESPLTHRLPSPHYLGAWNWLSNTVPKLQTLSCRLLRFPSSSEEVSAVIWESSLHPCTSDLQVRSCCEQHSNANPTRGSTHPRTQNNPLYMELHIHLAGRPPKTQYKHTICLQSSHIG